MQRKRRLRKVNSAQDFQMQEYDSVQYAVSDDIVAYMRGMSIRMRLSDGTSKNIKISLEDDGVWGYNKFETEEEKQAFKTAVEVVFPSGIKVLENMDYYGMDCPVSATTITLPYTLEKLGQEIFKTCTNLTSIVIPNSVTEIGMSAFALCTGLSSVTMSNNIEHIDDEAFSNCESLTSINLSTNASTLQLDQHSFFNCSNLRSITLPESLVEVGSGCFERCGITYIEIPSSLTSIPSDCFSYCSSLSSVTLNEGLETIGGDAFEGCSNLRSVTLPDSIVEVGSGCFERCGITYIEIPSTVTTIPYNCFLDCSSLSSVTLNEGLETIGLDAFKGCTSLTEIVVPDSVTYIDERAFPSNARIIYNGNLSGYPWGGMDTHPKLTLEKYGNYPEYVSINVDDNGV